MSSGDTLAQPSAANRAPAFEMTPELQEVYNGLEMLLPFADPVSYSQEVAFPTPTEIIQFSATDTVQQDHAPRRTTTLERHLTTGALISKVTIATPANTSRSVAYYRKGAARTLAERIAQEAAVPPALRRLAMALGNLTAGPGSGTMLYDEQDVLGAALPQAEALLSDPAIPTSYNYLFHHYLPSGRVQIAARAPLALPDGSRVPDTDWHTRTFVVTTPEGGIKYTVRDGLVQESYYVEAGRPCPIPVTAEHLKRTAATLEQVRASLAAQS